MPVSIRKAMNTDPNYFLCRLSEDPSIKVGVIEAGAYDPDVAQINVPGN
jgi:hypothetical protein